MSLARRRLPPLVAGILGLVVLGAAVFIGLGAGGDFGGTAARPGEAAETPPSETPPPLRPRPGSGPQMVPFELARFDGDGAVTLEDYAGTPLVLNFWASWCPFCIEEMPGFERIHDRFDGSVAFLGVGVRETSHSLAEELVQRTGVTYDLAEDPEGALFLAVEGRNMPTTLLITADGRVAERIGGPLQEAELERLILEHLVEEVP